MKPFLLLTLISSYFFCGTIVIAQQWELIGDNAYQNYKMTQARHAYEKALLEQSSPELMYKMAQTYDKSIREERQKSKKIALHLLHQHPTLDPILLVKTHTFLGNLYRLSSDFDSAQIHLTKAMSLGKKYHYTMPIRLLGRVHNSLGNTSKATYYFSQALKEAPLDNIDNVLSLVYVDLGVVNLNLGKLKEMEMYLNKALDLEKKNKYSEAKFMAYETFAKYYADNSDLKSDSVLVKKGIHYYELAYQNALHLNNTRSVAFCLMNKAGEYAFLGNLDKAKADFEEAKYYFDQLNDPAQLGTYIFSYGNFLFEYTSSKTQGLALQEQAAAIFKKAQNKAYEHVVVLANVSSFEKQGDYRKAFHYLNRVRELEKEMTGEEARKQVDELNIKYESQKKDALLATQKIDILQKQQRITQIGLGAAVITLSLLIVFLVYRWQQSRKIKRLESEFDQTTQQLQSFNYSVSHDLRHPLIAAKHALSTLPPPPLTPQQQQSMYQLQHSLENMEAIIDAMLTLAAIERDELRLKTVDTNELINDILQEFKSPVAVSVEVLPPVKADVRLLRQVFVNLISNAIKYSEPKENPEVRIYGKRTEKAVCFTVADNGIGFDERFSSKLFQLFGRLHPSLKGIGVGLVIVKRIIEKHQGQVYAHGKIQQGATFEFTIPQ